MGAAPTLCGSVEGEGGVATRGAVAQPAMAMMQPSRRSLRDCPTLILRAPRASGSVRWKLVGYGFAGAAEGQNHFLHDRPGVTLGRAYRALATRRSTRRHETILYGQQDVVHE